MNEDQCDDLASELPKTMARKATFMLRKLSGNFASVSFKQSNSSSAAAICRSNRLFSINLAQYVTQKEMTRSESESSTSPEAPSSGSESDGEVCAVTLDEDVVFCLEPDRIEGSATSSESVRSALLASNGLRFDCIESSMQALILDKFCTTVFAPGSLIVKQGEPVPGLMVVLTEGTAVTDVATGEWFSKGKVVSIESLAFGQHTCPYTLRVGEKYVVIATLPIEAYSCASVLRKNYLRSKYSILDTLSDSTLKRLSFDHKWLQPNESLDITDHISLMTHGVTRLSGVQISDRMFPGQVVGVSQLMSSKACCLISDTFAGCAVLSNCQFARCMQKETDFMNAINDICYQHSVIVENYGAVVKEDVQEPEVPSVIQQTTNLIRTYDEDGTLHFNQYRVISKIGSGATAAVFKVADVTVPLLFRVIKVMKRKDSGKSIIREVEALQALRHPNVIRAVDIIDSASASCVIIVQELAEWGSLLGVVLGMTEAKFCAQDCLSGLSYMHSMGYIHNDVKPANILRMRCGRTKLADFGCTRKVGAGPDLRPLGTPAFMSPEVLRNEACEASDIWAFAVTLFCLVYGTVPFRNVTGRSLREAIVYDEIPLQHMGTSVDETNFIRLCEAGLVKDHQKRISLHEMREHEWMSSNRPRRRRSSIVDHEALQ